MVRGRLLLFCVAAAMLAACQVQPGTPTPSFMVPVAGAAQGEATLTIHLRGLQRRGVLAKLTDVATVQVQVLFESGVQFLKNIDPAAIDQGQGTVTLTGLPEGKATVQVVVLDAQGLDIGRTSQAVMLAIATPTHVQASFQLDPNDLTGAARPSPGDLTIHASVVDGPLMVGTPQELPPKLSMTESTLATVYDSVEDFAFEPDGELTVVNMGTRYRNVPIGSNLDNLEPEGPNVLVLPNGNRVFIEQRGVVVLAPDDAVVGRFTSALIPADWQYRPRVACDSSNNIWMASGKHLWRLSPTAVELNHHDLPSSAYQLRVRPTTDDLWLTMAPGLYVGHYAATGDKLSMTAVSSSHYDFNGDSLQWDELGDLWTYDRQLGRIYKLGSDGRIKGYIQANPSLRGIVPNGKGALWVFSNFGFMSLLTKYSLDGRCLGTYDFLDPLVIDFGDALIARVDADGNPCYALEGSMDFQYITRLKED